jgi:hypothetical protein
MQNAHTVGRTIAVALSASIFALAAACGGTDVAGDELEGARGEASEAREASEASDGKKAAPTGTSNAGTAPSQDAQPLVVKPAAAAPAAGATAAWLFNGYCGGSLGDCSEAPTDCAAGEITDSACTDLAARCAGPANANGIRKKYVCTPRAERVWAFNGYCDSNPVVACTPSAEKPACAAGAGAGSACDAVGSKCVKSSKTFVCIPKTGKTWVANAICGDSFTGEKSCADSQHPLCSETGPGGKACDGTVDRCVTTNDAASAGKVFACVSR